MKIECFKLKKHQVLLRTSMSFKKLGTCTVKIEKRIMKPSEILEARQLVFNCFRLEAIWSHHGLTSIAAYWSTLQWPHCSGTVSFLPILVFCSVAESPAANGAASCKDLRHGVSVDYGQWACDSRVDMSWYEWYDCKVIEVLESPWAIFGVSDLEFRAAECQCECQCRPPTATASTICSWWILMGHTWLPMQR